MNTITKEQFIALVQNNKYFDIEEVTKKREELNNVINVINNIIEKGVTNTFNFKMYELSSVIYNSGLSESEQIDLFNLICEDEWYIFESEIVPERFELLGFNSIGRTSTRYILPKHSIEDRHEDIFLNSEKYDIDKEIDYDYVTWEKAIHEIAIGKENIESFEDIEEQFEYELNHYDIEDITEDDRHAIIDEWKDDLIVNLENELYLLSEIVEVLEQAKEFKEYLKEFQSEENAKQLFKNYSVDI